MTERYRYNGGGLDLSTVVEEGESRLRRNFLDRDVAIAIGLASMCVVAYGGPIDIVAYSLYRTDRKFRMEGKPNNSEDSRKNIL